VRLERHLDERKQRHDVGFDRCDPRLEERAGFLGIGVLGDPGDRPQKRSERKVGV